MPKMSEMVFKTQTMLLGFYNGVLPVLEAALWPVAYKQRKIFKTAKAARGGIAARR